MNFRFLDEVLYAEAVLSKSPVAHLFDDVHIRQGPTGSSLRRQFMIDAGGGIHHVFESIDEEEVQTWQWLRQGLVLKQIELTVPQWLKHGLILKSRLKRWFMRWQWKWLHWMWRTACDVEAGREPGCWPVVEDSDEEDGDNEAVSTSFSRPGGNPGKLETIVEVPDEDNTNDASHTSSDPISFTVTEYYTLGDDDAEADPVEASQHADVHRLMDSSAQQEATWSSHVEVSHMRWDELMEIAWSLTDTPPQERDADSHIAAERWAAKQWAERLTDPAPLQRDEKQRWSHRRRERW